MELALYSAATGMDAQQRNLDVIANDIANVNTTAYKRTQNDFKDLIYQTLKPIGMDPGDGTKTPTGIQVGNGTQLAATTKIFTQGQLTQTGYAYCRQWSNHKNTYRTNQRSFKSKPRCQSYASKK